VVRLDELLARLTAQNFIRVREHEGLQTARRRQRCTAPQPGSPCRTGEVEQAIEGVTAMKPDEKPRGR